MLDITFPEKEKTENMPSLNHSYICTQILKQLLQNANLLPLTELTLNIEKGLTPDISVYPAEKIKLDFFQDVAKYDEMPILAIEVISSSQNIQDVLIKARKLSEAGIPSVLTLEPYTRTVFLTQKETNNQLFHNQVVEAGGISIDFKGIFEPVSV
jgi:Uma2 family endonuclease